MWVTRGPGHSVIRTPHPCTPAESQTVTFSVLELLLLFAIAGLS